MDVAVDLDEETVRELEEEAGLQGFDGLDAYLRWIVAHRPMSDLASSQAPAVASRVSELEERVKLVERQLGLDEPVDPDADLGDGGGAGGGGGTLDASGSDEFGGGFESAAGGGGSGDLGSEEADPDPDPDEPEDAAEDDDIAEAIGDVSLEDEDDEA